MRRQSMNNRLRFALAWCDAHKNILDAELKDYNSRARKRPDKRYAHIKRTYSIDKKQYEAMLSNQNNHCAICGGPFRSFHDTHVDHDHATGSVRGILCFKCNVLLGNCNDSVRILNRAIEYLGVKLKE